MRTKLILAIIVALSSSSLFAQCPQRPQPATVVQDALNLYSQNGVLNANFPLGYSVDVNGYTHYCYKYETGTGVAEAPTLRLNPGDILNLNVTDGIVNDTPHSKSA